MVSVAVSETLMLAMRIRKIELATSPKILYSCYLVLLHSSSAGLWLALPLFDGIPKSILSDTFLRVVMVLAVLTKLFLIVYCKADLPKCNEYVTITRTRMCALPCAHIRTGMHA